MSQKLDDRHARLRGEMLLCEHRIQGLRARLEREQHRWALLLEAIAKVQREQDESRRV